MLASHNGTIKGLLLDLDNTLYRYEPAHQAGLSIIFDCLQRQSSISKEELENAFEQGKLQVKRRLHNTAASHHRLLYLQAMLEQLGLFSPKLTSNLYKQYWSTFFAAMQPLPGLNEALSRLAQNYRIGVITNFVADIQYQKLEQLGIDHLITCLVTSEEVGCEKPDQKIFLAACKKMQLRPEELCMVGDDLAADIMPAQHLGMETYWLTPELSTTQPEHSLFKTCSTFYDLEKRLS